MLVSVPYAILHISSSPSHDLVLPILFGSTSKIFTTSAKEFKWNDARRIFLDRIFKGIQKYCVAYEYTIENGKPTVKRDRSPYSFLN